MFGNRELTKVYLPLSLCSSLSLSFRLPPPLSLSLSPKNPSIHITLSNPKHTCHNEDGILSFPWTGYTTASTNNNYHIVTFWGQSTSTPIGLLSIHIVYTPDLFQSQAFREDGDEWTQTRQLSRHLHHVEN